MPSTEPTVLVAGLGEIGRSVVREALVRGWRVAACADLDPEAAAARLTHEIAGDRMAELPVEEDVAGLLAHAEEGAVAVLCTASRAAAVSAQVAACVDAGVDVVTTCEELAWPAGDTVELLSDIDLVARRAGRTVLATGINPGFLMDALPVVAAAASLEVTHVEVVRSISLDDRRAAFRRKIPTDCTAEELARIGEDFGHVGLLASARLVAERLGWRAEDTSTETRPVLDDRGLVTGLLQSAVVRADGEDRVTLRWEAKRGLDEPSDRIRLHGVPTTEITVHPSIHGDIGTVAMVLNGVMSLHEGGGRAGLRRPADEWTMIGAARTTAGAA
jgi:2,4-diaminopentanoate dehydrogenase